MPALFAHHCALTRDPCCRSELEAARLREYLAALEAARQQGTIDEAEFETVRCAACLHACCWGLAGALLGPCCGAAARLGPGWQRPA